VSVCAREPRRARARHAGLACGRLRPGARADEVNGKAGNLNHALRLMYPRGAPVAPGEVVAVFDCDQARRMFFPGRAGERGSLGKVDAC